MGLGKTLMSLSLLAYLKQYRSYGGPHLIIVPKSTSSNWLKEVRRWTSNLSVFRFHGNAEEREALKPEVRANDITVTTYEMVILEKSFFAKVDWHYIYIDEAHRIKNENSLLSRVVRTFKSEHRLLITGTRKRRTPTHTRGYINATHAHVCRQ
jgi:SWI/SNF-related matrix-associated actin-dependent regulator of chromatin subfamily A member 5